jgi:cytochrome c-type biogenesis protein CcmE
LGLFNDDALRVPAAAAAQAFGNETRHKRIALIAGGLAALGVAAALILNAFQSNLVFFFSPTQVIANEAPPGRAFRIGGMVEAGSVKRQDDGLTVRFNVTDTAKTMHPTSPRHGGRIG